MVFLRLNNKGKKLPQRFWAGAGANTKRRLVFSLILLQGCNSSLHYCLDMKDSCSKIVTSNRFVYAVYDTTICEPNFFDDISWVSFSVNDNLNNQLEALVRDDFNRISARDTRGGGAIVMVTVFNSETNLDLVMKLIERAYITSNAKSKYDCYTVTFIYKNMYPILLQHKVGD